MVTKGLGCALFLAKFMTTLGHIYRKKCKQEGYKDWEFVPHIYNNCLVNCLFTYAKEDAEEHGRLREIQSILFAVDERIMPMTKEEEMQFYLNDIKVFNKHKKHGGNSGNAITDFQNKYSYFSNWNDLFNEMSTQKITDKVLPSFKSAILNKKSIFSDASQYKVVGKKIEELRVAFMSGTFSRKIYNYLEDDDLGEFNITDRSRISYTSKNQLTISI